MHQQYTYVIILMPDLKNLLVVRVYTKPYIPKHHIFLTFQTFLFILLIFSFFLNIIYNIETAALLINL
jgi:hypothetical protein